MAALPKSCEGSLTTVGEALSQATRRLRDAGIERPEAEARILLEAASGRGRGQIIAFPEHPLPDRHRLDFDALIARRCVREPISRILGRREFWSLSFKLDAGTLDPRPDSETLVTAVLERVRDRAARLDILDLGTGTGCLLLALLSELPAARGVGVDVSEAATRGASRNAERLGLSERAEFIVSDWARDLDGAFDIVISNPPYIESDAIDGLAPEVARHDPRAALDGGADGLDAYRALLPQAARLLRAGGLLVLEMGQGQGAAVCNLARRAGFIQSESAADLAGIERCLLFRK
jgi:release factor glutamine methyltransferase